MREIVLIIHFIGLAMGLGTSFAYMFLGMAASKMETENRIRFMLNTASLSKMGHIGYVLLVISGLYLMTPYWKTLPEQPLLITKLVLVLVLGALIGLLSSFMRKAAQGNAEAYFARSSRLGPFAMICGIAIVAIAVYIFR